MKTFKKVIPFLVAALMVVSLAACGATNNNAKADPGASASASTEQAKAFPKFQGTDFDGNAVDESMFSQNGVTVLNFWYNGCPACVDEMSSLDKFNQKLREKGAELVGVNVEAGEDSNALKEAKEILAKQGVTYRNIGLKAGKEINDYLSSIYGFPTTVLVDRNGNIIGDPILGAIDDEARMADILKTVESTVAGEPASTTEENASGNDINALVMEENNIFSEHEEVWNKVLGEAKDDSAHLEQDAFIPFLKEQLEKAKDSLSAEELNLLSEDIQKIEAIEQRIQDLEDSKS